ncbi:MAG: DUF3810 domain-containing protein [bacterium]|nr:DUF3810 domain-containing protein [bacterium]
MYVFIAFLVIFDIYKITMFMRKRKIDKKDTTEKAKGGSLTRGLRFIRRFNNGVLNLLAAVSIIVALFLVVWGYNYARPPIEEHLKIDPKPLDLPALKKEAQYAFDTLTAARSDILGATTRELTMALLPAGLETELRESLEKTLKQMDYPAPGRVRCRKLYPGGVLMHFGAAGLYNLFLGEGYIAADLHAVSMPFCMAHEMCHGFGFAAEGTANFLAYVACRASQSPIIRYSACITYWNHVAGELYRADPAAYTALVQKLPHGVRSDLSAVYKKWQSYRSVLRKVGRAANDTYLKMQGVKEGIKSYNRLVVLTAAWRAKP